MARRSSASRRSTRGVFRAPSYVYWRRRAHPLAGPAGITLSPPGIPSEELVPAGAVQPGTVYLSPPGIPGEELVGAGRVVDGIPLFPPGIPGAELVPAGAIQPGTVYLSPPGIGSEEVVGAGSLIVTFDPRTRQSRPAAAAAPVYELMVIARIPQIASPPAYLEVDPISWSTLQWTETLSAPQSLTVTAPVASITDPVAQRLGQPDRLATELWLYRDGTKIFAGPLRTVRVSGLSTVEITADGLASYLDRMVLTESVTYTQLDQHFIAKSLVDIWQAYYEYTHLGIDTSAITASGILRDRAYVHTEVHVIGQRVRELGAVSGGFDHDVDPVTRRLQLWTPQVGVDRSTGSDAIIFDDRNLMSADYSISVAAQDFATYAFGAGSSAGTEGTLWAPYYSQARSAQYGGTAVASSWSDVTEQATLNDHTIALLNARGQALVVPGPKIRVGDDIDLGNWAVGDTVRLEIGGRLGLSGSWRVRKRAVTVDTAGGTEFVDIEFV